MVSHSSSFNEIGGQAPENSRRILLIGGAGYVGTVLARKLLSGGHAVRVLDNLLYKNGHSLHDLAEEPAFSFVRGDLCDLDVLERSLTDITDVVLLAGLVGDPICKKYPKLARKVNVAGIRGVFDALAGKRIGSFVFTSTCSNYGVLEGDTLATEETELNPKSSYAEAKVAFEQHVLANAAKVDFCPTILRIATAFGLSRRMRFDLTVSEFTRELAVGNELLVYDEHTWRPYCHVADLSAAVIRVLESPAELVGGEVFNVGSNANNYTKKMIVDAVLEKLGAGKVKYAEAGPDPRSYCAAFDKIEKQLGYRAVHTVSGAIGSLIAAVKGGLFDDVEIRRTAYGNYVIEGAE